GWLKPWGVGGFSFSGKGGKVREFEEDISEFRNKEMNDFCSRKGIKREFSNARTPQQNGDAKRRNRTLIEAARTMLADAKLPGSLKQKGMKDILLDTLCLAKHLRSGNPNPTATTTNPPADQMEKLTVETPIPTVSSPVLTACFEDYTEPLSINRIISKRVTSQDVTPSLDNISTLANRFDDILRVTTSTVDSHGEEADVLKNKKDERGIVIRNKARLVAQGNTQEEGIDYNEIDVKSAFLYGTIDEEVYVMQSPRFQDPEFPARVYKVEKAMYGLHQAPIAWYALMRKKFQMSAMGELNFFLGLQVLQKEDDIFLSRDKYVGDILKQFRYSDVRSANTPMDKENPWGKDEIGKDVDLHLYRSMIGSLMYLTASRPDIMFAVCACARHQVTPKECHLYAVKRIFRYLKGHPKLGLWYPKESPVDLVAYSDSDYGGATQDCKSTTGGSASGCGQVLWIQNQLLDYGYNFMNTKIYIDNNSAILKSAFLYGKIAEEVYVTQPRGFKDPDHPKKVYKVVKALYRLHQAPRVWYERLSTFLLKHVYRRGTINKTLFIKKDSKDIMLVQVYVDDIIFGFTFLYGTIEEEVYVCQPPGFEDPDHLDKVYKVVKALYGLHQAPRAWKFGLTEGKSTSTPIDTEKPLLKDPDGEDIDMHTYRSMIGSMMYLTSSRLDIMFAFWSTARIETTEEGTKILATIDGEGSGTPTEPHHIRSPEALQTSPTTHLSPSLPTDTTKLLPTDRANIAKTSTLPSDSTPRVTSLNADEGSMQQHLNELTDLCTRLQRQQEEMASKITAQDLEISQLKARVKLLEDKEGGGVVQSGEDAPIKGRSLDEGEEAVVERMNIPPAVEFATATVSVPIGSGSIPTASPPDTGVPTGGVPTGSDVVPTASPIFTTATVATPYIRRKEEELQIMIDGLDRNNETVAKYLQEYYQFARDLPIGERIELISNLVKYQDNYAKVFKYHIQQRKPLLRKQQKEFYMSVLKSHADWKARYFKGMTLEEIKEKFDPVWKKIQDFIPFEEVPEEKLKEMMELIPVEEVYMEALQVKHPIIDWEVYTIGEKSYWKIIRLRGSITSYQFFVDLLKHFDREDLNQLWALVKETLNIRPATNDKEKELWVELKRLYEPDVEDLLWTHNQNMMHAPVEWKLYVTCGVHHLISKDQEMLMLVDKDYPLRKGLEIVTISYKLQGRIVGNKMHKAFPLPVKSSHYQKKFPLLVRKVPPAEEKRCHCYKDYTTIEDRGESHQRHIYNIQRRVTVTQLFKEMVP
nr:hypothetical protein [Tanacetum cinerariifolium]